MSILDSDPIMSAMGRDMKRKYDKYWGNIAHMNELIYFGVILDPCYKMRFLEFEFPNMYNDQPAVGKELLSKVKDKFFKLYDWYVAAQGQQNRNRPSSSGSSVVGSNVSAEQPTR